MQILLNEAVEHLGSPGDLVEVKSGYARNFLLPRNKAIVVTRQNRPTIEKEIEKHRRKETKRLDGLRQQAEKLSAVNCTVVSKADENDKLYGSVTPADIAKALKVSGFDIPPKKIVIPEPIRAVGVYTVKVQLEKDIAADLKVWVVK